MDRIGRIQLALLALSAVTLAASYLFILVGWIGIFLFLIPLFYGTFYRPYTFLQGLWWGGIFYIIHWYDIFFLVLYYGKGYFKVPLFIILLCYMIIHAGIWFFSVDITSKYIPGWISWIGVTVLYFYYVEHGIFWIFGTMQGYYFASLLIPLASTHLIQSVGVIGPLGLSALIIAISYIIAWEIYYGELRYASATLIFYVIVDILCWNQKPERPWYLSYIGYIKPSHDKVLLDRVQIISQAVDTLFKKNPSIRLILLPESSIPCVLTEHEDFLYLLGKQKCTICLGAYRFNPINENYHNSLFMLHNSRIMFFYDKQSLFPLTEQLPSHINKESPLNLFLQTETLSAGCATQNNSIHLFFGPVSCALCSELFQPRVAIQLPQPIIIWLVNDSWFCTTYMRTLMWQTARLRAILLKKEIFYVCYENAYWINPYGFYYKIQS